MSTSSKVESEVPSLGTDFLVDHRAFLSKTGEKTSKKFSLPSPLEGTLLSKVGSTLSKALLFIGSDRVSIAAGRRRRWGHQRSRRRGFPAGLRTFSYTGEVVVVSFLDLLSCSFPFVRMMLQHDRFVCELLNRTEFVPVMWDGSTKARRETYAQL